MKFHIIFSIIGLSLSAACLANPSPHDIEDAINAGNLAKADSMLREVIQEKPGSAVAHYRFGQVLAMEGRHQQALSELQQAGNLDQSFGFAASRDTYLKKVQNEQALAGPVASIVYTPPISEHSSHWLLWTLFIAALIGGAYLLMRRKVSEEEESQAIPMPHEFRPTSPGAAATPSSTASTPRTATSSTVPPQAPPRPYAGGASHYAAPPSTVVVNNGNSGNGFVEGVLVAEMLNSPRRVERETIVERERTQDVERAAPAPSPAPSPSSSYDSGSSSYESGSSSSYDSGSSSYDGGSSSGSDW